VRGWAGYGDGTISGIDSGIRGGRLASALPVEVCFQRQLTSLKSKLQALRKQTSAQPRVFESEAEGFMGFMHVHPTIAPRVVISGSVPPHVSI